MRNFEWNQCNYKDAIEKSITYTFYLAINKWQEHEYKLFLIILYENGFLGIVEDLVEPDLLE